jgi:hypothetical protein
MLNYPTYVPARLVAARARRFHIYLISGQDRPHPPPGSPGESHTVPPFRWFPRQYIYIIICVKLWDTEVWRCLNLITLNKHLHARFTEQVQCNESPPYYEYNEHFWRLLGVFSHRPSFYSSYIPLIGQSLPWSTLVLTSHLLSENSEHFLLY